MERILSNPAHTGWLIHHPPSRCRLGCPASCGRVSGDHQHILGCRFGPQKRLRPGGWERLGRGRFEGGGGSAGWQGWLGRRWTERRQQWGMGWAGRQPNDSRCRHRPGWRCLEQHHDTQAVTRDSEQRHCQQESIGRALHRIQLAIPLPGSHLIAPEHLSSTPKPTLLCKSAPPG